MIHPLLYLGLVTGWLVGSFALMDLLFRCFTGQLRMPGTRRRDRGPFETARRPIEEVGADLRRLSRQLEVVPTGTPQARRRGWQAAYDDVLIEAARLLELPQSLREVPPGRARDAERRRVEIALAAAGMRGSL